MPQIIHVVHFQFFPTATPEDIKGVSILFVHHTDSNTYVRFTSDEVSARFLSLKDNCLHPTTQSPYIQSAIGGKDISPEGLQGNFTHTWILEFKNEEDRNYYIKTDPAHMAFGQSLTGLVEKVMVMDFYPGVF